MGSHPPLIAERASRLIPSRRLRAFTLAELLVVLVIISFASTVALLAYSNYRKAATARGAAEKVKRVLVEARSRAIADGRPSQVVFDLTAQVMWIDDLETNGQIRAPKVTPPEPFGPGVVVETVQIQSTTFSDGLIQAVFRPDGTNPLTKVILRREAADPSVDENYYTVQIYPTSAEPRVWPNARR
jgi:prepilin-type N-terminal cleavage/methylation domain-containing protein